MVKTEVVKSRNRVTADELKQFVKTYQEASSIAEVAKKMAWKVEKVRTQATRVRKAGVPLKAFKRGGASVIAPIVEDLKKLCAI